jgi:uncharacterized DUF497 family protein
MNAGGRSEWLTVTAYCCLWPTRYQDGDIEVIRVISARRATRQEERRYGDRKLF